MKRIFLEIVAFVLTLCLLVGLAAWLGNIYMPSRLDSGATWHMFLEEKEQSVDVLVVGSSLAYCDIIPAEIYRRTGHTAYVLAAPYMKPDIAYFYLKEALRTQRPQAILLEASSLFFSDKEADYYKVNIGYMPWGKNRWEATLAAPTQYRAGLLFPMYNYHSRWQEVHPRAYLSGRGDDVVDLQAGYTLLTDTVSQKQRSTRKFLAEGAELEQNFVWLDKLAALCKEENIPLELFIVPSCEYPDADCIRRLQATGLPLTDFNADFDACGLDIATDFYDSRHLNLGGALKYSARLADHIKERFDLQKTPHDETLWQQRLQHIDGKRKEFFHEQ